jgi:hypothetical protein
MNQSVHRRLLKNFHLGFPFAVFVQSCVYTCAYVLGMLIVCISYIHGYVDFKTVCIPYVYRCICRLKIVCIPFCVYVCWSYAYHMVYTRICRFQDCMHTTCIQMYMSIEDCMHTILRICMLIVCISYVYTRICRFQDCMHTISIQMYMPIEDCMRTVFEMLFVWHSIQAKKAPPSCLYRGQSSLPPPRAVGSSEHEAAMAARDRLDARLRKSGCISHRYFSKSILHMLLVYNFLF